MANNLSLLQQQAFSGPDVSIDQVQRIATLIDPTGGETIVTEDINSLGKLRFQVYNLHPARRGLPEIPTMQWSVINDDFRYSPGDVDSVWFPYEPSEFQMRIQMSELITHWRFTPQNPAIPNVIMDCTMQVLEVTINGEEAEILGTNGASFLLNRFWTEEDGDPIDWTAAGTNQFKQLKGT